MLVYGDHVQAVSPPARLAEIAAQLDADTEDARCAALILAGELAQGLADSAFEAAGEIDDLTEAGQTALALVVAIAARGGEDEALERLRAQRLPERIACKTAEGFAYYAVYPAAYAAAARSIAWPTPPLVIGLRSIGTALAGVVAAATGAAEVLTLRPQGHPFRRRVRVSASVEERLVRHRGPFAIVDEGPGLSGSSFGAAADLLQGLGAPLDRLVFLPSHAGDLGPKADPAHRSRWARVQRRTVDFEALWRDDPPGRWFEDLTGPVTACHDLSGGRWRDWRVDGASLPAQVGSERRKLRIEAAHGWFRAKFAGLGETGERAFDRARRLHAEGFVPEPLALRRGFLLERWIDGAAPALTGPGRAALLDRLGEYLAFRASDFPTGPGASAAELAEMVRVNAGETLAACIRPLLGAKLRPVAIDGRLQPWEWIAAPDGRLMKTDALDHASSHDLVGGQDIAWDVAGAVIEYGLTQEETARLARRLGGAAGSPELLAAFQIAYAAFQTGAWSLALDAAPAGDRPAILSHRDRYLRRLRAPVEPASSTGAAAGVQALTFSPRLTKDNEAKLIVGKYRALLGDPNDLNSYSNKLRARRDVRLRELIARIAKEKGSVRILDVGGALEYWKRVGLEFLREQHATVTLLNLPQWAISPITGAEDIFTVEVGDGCDLSQYADNAFDLTHSNSVVEHVITWSNMKAFAAETRRVGRYYYVQTPYYWFPIDPHFYRAPFFHWMPTPLRAFLLTRFRVAYAGKLGSLDEAYTIIDEHRLIDRTRFKQLFPDSDLTFERFMLLPKSMVGVRAP